MAEKNLQRIRHTDQLIFNENGDLIGIQNPKGHGEDFLPIRLSSDGTSLVDGDRNVISFAGPAYTFANLPAASANAGNSVRVTDVGPAGSGSIWISDGVQWCPMNGRAIVAKSSIPLIMPSSGSMGNNGAITLTTALPLTYAKCYLYLPANAISAGSAAGWYYAEMAGTTTGIVYNNPYLSGRPSIPSANTAFVTTGPGAYTQTTGSDLPSLRFTIPANALGLYGGLEYFSSIVVNNTAGTKTLKGFFGSTAFMILTAANNTWADVVGGFSNSGQAAVQRQLTQDFSLGLVGGASYSPTTGAIDSTAAQVASITLKLATATDYIILQGTRIELVC